MGNAAVMEVPSSEETMNLKLFNQVFNTEMVILASFSDIYNTWNNNT